MGIAKTYFRGGRFAIEHPFALILTAIVVVLPGDLLRGLATGRTQFIDTGTLAWDGPIRGPVISLVGIGLSMVYSILDFANFSHGGYIVTGASSGWVTMYFAAGLGYADIGALLLVGTGRSVYGGTLGIGMLSTPLAVVADIVVSGSSAIALSLAVDRTIFKSIRNEDGITLLIASTDVAFALRYLMQFVFGSDAHGTTAQPPSLSLDFIDDTMFIDAHDITFLVVALALILGIHVLLQRTKPDKAMRAMADNKGLALTTGISTERVVRATWIIGDRLTGAVGRMFILWEGTFGFNDGWLLLLLIFAAVTLGDIGSTYGVITGDLVIGLTASMPVLWIPSAFSRVAIFTIMVVILFMRPSGLLSRGATA